MYDIQSIIECYKGFIGWRNSNNPCDKPLNTELTTSESGLYFNEFHPLLTPENIKSIAVNPKTYGLATWDILDTYNTGDKVIFNDGKYDYYYTSLIDGNIGIQPDINPLQWEEIDFLSDWYEQRTNNSFNKLINSIAIEKKLNHKTKTILDNFKLFQSNGRLADLIVKAGRFVGYRIRLKQSENIIAKIKKIGFQFTETQTGLNIYLYHTSQKEPLAVTPVTTTKAISFEWFNYDTILRYVGSDYDTGEFYLGYYEDDITGQAINKKMDWRNPCFGCQGWKQEDYRAYSQFIDIVPITVPNGDLELDNSMFDIRDVRYLNNTNFGINLDLSIKCDWSDFICNHKDLFANAYRLQVAKDMLNEMLFSTRDNDLRQKINAAIQGNDENNSLEAKLQKEVEALNFDMSDLGTPCMPCEKQKGIRLKSA